MKTTSKSLLVLSAIILSLILLQSCKQNDAISYTKPQIDSLKNIALKLVADNDTIADHLKTFDELDFDVFSNQKWERLKESHAPNIKVYWPDGHVAEGIDQHIEDLKKLFVHAPDTRIKVHPIKFGSGNYTLVTGVFEGTFTKPMPIGNGKFIQPTGKAFKMPMATVGIWEKWNNERRTFVLG